MSALRRNLRRSGYSTQYREQMGVVVALIARMVDLAANLTHLRLDIPECERERMRRLAQKIAGIRADFERGAAPLATDLHIEHEGQSSVPLLREMETTIALIPEAFTGCESLKAYAPPESYDAPPATVPVQMRCRTSSTGSPLSIR
jgi:multidrug resistance protein MdtO